MSAPYRGVRRNICDLIDEYDQGNTTALDKLIAAFQYIQYQLPSSDDNSFFKIAGYHGEPFRGAGWGNSSWWGGYCQHGNVLFPTWHRAYIMRLEDALRSVEGCSDVTLPYWDETSQRTASEGLPRIFLEEQYTFGDTFDDRKNTSIDNPLRSYTLQADVWDNTNDGDYTKPYLYKTVRYPFSGLMGPDDEGTTEQHNRLVSLLDSDGTDGGTDELLNDNVKSWLGSSITMKSGQTFYTHTAIKYKQCLLADNYTVFSNTTSAMAWNEDHFHKKKWPATSSSASQDLPVVPLESPHNDIHLAIGGFDMGGNFSAGWVADANGDMGENNTAAFDPIFYFHHCFIDKKFWEWQQINNSKDKLEIIDEYPGTNSVDSQGPTPGVPGNVWLTMDTPLAPFKNGDGTSRTSNVRKILAFALCLAFLSSL